MITALMVIGMTNGLAAQTQPLLQLQGQPYFGGSMKLHVTAPSSIGQPALVAFGLNPLTAPIETGKGPWYIGSLVNLVALGNIPTGGRIDLPFGMPPVMPAFAGLPIVMQGYVSPRLSNPALLRLDEPYLTVQSAAVLTAPAPKVGGKFGDRATTGDFDGDGFLDVAVGAAYENYLGMADSGHVYVMWGPAWDSATALASPAPGAHRFFGGGLAAADFDDDGLDDLAASEMPDDIEAPIPIQHAKVHVFRGTADRALGPAETLTSPFVGLSAGTFGRSMTAGDVTGDGWPDLVVSVGSAALGGQIFSGAIMIVPGPSLISPWVIPNPTPVGGDFFGNCVELADVDSDGALDIVEGSGRADVVSQQTGTIVVNAGEVHIGYGPGFGTWAAFQNPTGLAFDDRFGDHVTTLRTAGGSRVAELATTNDNNDGYVLRVDTGGLVVAVPKPPSLTTNPFGETAYGYAVLSSDVNRDGQPDILIGDAFEGAMTGCSLGNSGIVYAVLGPYYSTFLRIAEPSPQCGVGFSWVVERADMNSDGIEDLIVASPGATVQGTQSAGRVVVLFGGF